MLLDGHIHVSGRPADKPGLINKMKNAGIGGGVILSKAPNSFGSNDRYVSNSERLANLLSWTAGQTGFYPLYWIDPTEEDAVEQVKMAVESNIAGFKIICNKFYPGDSRALKVYRAIAAHKKPILFHSGILWDGQSSSNYNRPSEFEALLDIDGLKFTLAHVSWPWCDECIAVYGKFLNAYASRPDLSVEMFIDITPGTPPIYRDEVITKLFTVGYDIENNIIFGSDCLADDYNDKWVREWIERDNSIYKKLGLSDTQLEKIYSKNLERFLGLSSDNVTKKVLIPGQ